MFYQMRVDPITHVVTWQMLFKDNVLNHRMAPQDITITLKMIDQTDNTKTADNLPQIYFLPNGDLTPFEITIHNIIKLLEKKTEKLQTTINSCTHSHHLILIVH